MSFARSDQLFPELGTANFSEVKVGQVTSLWSTGIAIEMVDESAESLFFFAIPTRFDKIGETGGALRSHRFSLLKEEGVRLRQGPVTAKELSFLREVIVRESIRAKNSGEKKLAHVLTHAVTLIDNPDSQYFYLKGEGYSFLPPPPLD